MNSAAPAVSSRVWVAFTLLSATFFMLLVDFSIVTIALPSIETEMHMSAAQGQWVISIYAIFLAGFLMLTGRCADIYGRFRFFVVGLVIFTTASFLGGLSQNGAMLITMRAIQGLGAALVNPAALAIVLSLFAPGPQRSRAVALWGTIGSLGVAAGMLLGGIIVQYLGWRWVLFVNVPVAAIILGLALLYVPRDSGDASHPKLDVMGAILLTAALMTSVYTIESLPIRGLLAWQTAAGLFAVILLFGGFVAVERRAAEPILPARLFHYPDLLSGCTVVLFEVMSFAAVIVFASVYVQQVSHYQPLFAGLAFMPSTLLVSFVAAPLTMPIARAIGVRTMGIVMTIVMIAGESILLFIEPGSSYWARLFPAMMIGSFGSMLSYQAGMIAGLAHVDDADEGCASAAISFALQLGIGLGVALCAAVEAMRTPMLLHAGASPIDALAGGLQATFAVALVFAVATLLAIIFGLRHAATAEIPLRHYVPFGRLHHRISVRS